MRKVLLLVSILLFAATLVAQDTTRLTLLFTGDIMQHDSNIAAAWDKEKKQYDYASCFQYIAPILRSADCTIGNLELTLAGAPYKGYPQFSAPDALAVALKDVGFDVLVTANNHSADRGRKGIERTIRVLDSLQMRHTGTFLDSTNRAQQYPLIIEQKGIKISLLNYTYGTNGLPVPKPNVVNLIDTTQIANDLIRARAQQSDVIIVFFHWGDEYQSLPNNKQKQLATWCLKKGVSIVMGAHPHVLQPMEWNKEQNQLVVYSLGNFLSGQRPRYRDGGAMVWLDLIKVTKDSVSSTWIRNAAYELEWVYKSSDNYFTMLPLRYFESDTVVIKEPALQQAKEQFKTDSRSLLQKHNVNVTERIVTNDSAYFRIEWIPQQPDDVQKLNSAMYTLQHDDWDDRIFWIGNFADQSSAENAIADLQALLPQQTLRIRKFLVR